MVVNGNPAICYFDFTLFNLKYVRALDASGTSWGTPGTVAVSGDVGRHPSMAVVDGNPAISYFDNTFTDLKYVRALDASGTSWSSPVTLDSSGNVGEFTSLAVVNGNPAISYYDATNADLKYVRALNASGTIWGTPVTLDSTGNVGQDTSLAAVNGNPGISYFDATNGNLKWATYGVFVPEIAIEQPALTNIASGGSRGFGPVLVGSTADLVFTLLNTGTADLTLSGTPKVDVTGADAAHFSVTTQPTSPVEGPSGSTTFTVRFAPTSTGAKLAALSIATNDADENSFTINLTGTGTDTSGPTGGTMSMTPPSPVDASAALTVNFTGWADPSLPLAFTVLVDDVIVSPAGPTSSRNITGPATPGAHTLKGRIADAVGNFTEVMQNFTVLTAQETWRFTYFGITTNTGNAADLADPDGDGGNNVFEFVAGLVPTDPASRFALRVEAVTGQPTQFAILLSPLVAGRTYVVKSKASLTDPAWVPLGSSSTSDNGTERTVTDLAAGSGKKFYIVEITLP